MIRPQTRLVSRHVLASLAAALIACLPGAAQDAVERAREAVARAGQAEAAYAALQAEGNPEKQVEMTVLAREAEAARKEARAAYGEAGFPGAADLGELREYVELLRSTGDFDLAAEAVEQAIAKSPEDGSLRVELGENYAEIGPAKRDAAFRALHEGLEHELTESYEARAHFRLGQLYFEEGLYQFARESFVKVLEIQPDAVRTRIALAALDAREGKMAEASAAIDQLGRDAQPYDIETRLLLRRVLIDFDDQRRSFPDTAENHLAYARILYRAARIQDALAAGEHASRRNPTSTAILNFVASMHMQLGHAGPARAAYERSLSLDPIQPAIRQSLSTIPVNAR